MSWWRVLDAALAALKLARASRVPRSLIATGIDAARFRAYRRWLVENSVSTGQEHDERCDRLVLLYGDEQRARDSYWDWSMPGGPR